MSSRNPRYAALNTGAPTRFAIIMAVGIAVGLNIGARRGLHKKWLPIEPVRHVAVLELKVSGDGNRLRLTWNRSGRAIRAASRGLLSITDGEQQSIWNLDTRQLNEGSIAYCPVAEDVRFRLVVFQNEHATNESVRSVGGPRCPGIAPSAPGPEISKAPIPVLSRFPGGPHPAKAMPPVDRPEEVADARPLTIKSRPTIPTPAQDSVIPRPLDIPLANRPLDITPSRSVAEEPIDASSIVTVEAKIDSGFGRAISKIPLIRRYRKPPSYVPPKPLRQMPPVVPAELRSGIKAQVRIDIRVYVNEFGKVEYAEPLSEATGVNRALMSLAVYAARRWEFEPAQEGERKVAGKMILHYVFAPPKTASE